MVKKTGFMRWIDGQLEADPGLAQAVEDRLTQMKLEQQIVALREKRGLTQRQLARLLGTSQPYVAKLESGRVRNLGVKTLVKCARALGASVSITMEPTRSRIRRSSSRLRKAG
jgi:transcriptional regulator with XRE-family HTH domain